MLLAQGPQNPKATTGSALAKGYRRYCASVIMQFQFETPNL